MESGSENKNQAWLLSLGIIFIMIFLIIIYFFNHCISTFFF